VREDVKSKERSPSCSKATFCEVIAVEAEVEVCLKICLLDWDGGSFPSRAKRVEVKGYQMKGKWNATACWNAATKANLRNFSAWPDWPIFHPLGDFWASFGLPFLPKVG